MRTVGAFLILTSLTITAEAMVIEMKREAEIDRNIVRLADVARVYDAPADLRRQYEAIYVTLAPAPGQVKTVALKDVRRRLRAHGVNLTNVILEGPVTVRLRRPRTRSARSARAQAIQPAALTDLATKYVAGQLGRTVSDIRVTFDGLSRRRLQRLARKPFRFAVVAEGVPVRLGHNNLTVLGYQGTEARERLTVVAEVKAYAQVPVAARGIARGRHLRPADFRMERRMVGDPACAALTSADLVGRIASRAVRKGAMIEPEAVANAPLVRRGDMVTVIARAAHVEVKTVGEALQDGAARETIKVRNPDSRKVFLARVEAPRTVVVEVKRGGTKQ